MAKEKGLLLLLVVLNSQRIHLCSYYSNTSWPKTRHFSSPVLKRCGSFCCRLKTLSLHLPHLRPLLHCIPRPQSSTGCCKSISATLIPTKRHTGLRRALMPNGFRNLMCSSSTAQITLLSHCILPQPIDGQASVPFCFVFLLVLLVVFTSQV